MAYDESKSDVQRATGISKTAIWVAAARAIGALEPDPGTRNPDHLARQLLGDPSELEAIFNPFTRGDRARGGKGTGLGLAIVKRIASMHGGNVELRNRSGGGLEARVRLPLGLMLPRDAV